MRCLPAHILTSRLGAQICFEEERTCDGVTMTVSDVVIGNNSVINGPGGGLAIDGTLGLRSINTNEVTGNAGKGMGGALMWKCA